MSVTITHCGICKHELVQGKCVNRGCEFGSAEIVRQEKERRAAKAEMAADALLRLEAKIDKVLEKLE